MVSYLHHDQLGSVVLITDATGARAREMAYRPYGDVLYSSALLPAVPAEARGFIGERFDAGAGLQYLNARYYDPKLGMFLQPDWFEVTEAGVGTNRYAYAGGDLVNVGGPGGNSATSSPTQPVTVTFAEVEIRNYRQGNAEVVLTYPHPNIRIAYTRTTAGVLAFSIEYLFTDQLGSIRDVVKGAVRSSLSTYEPFGKPIDVVQPSIISEAHGYIGERFDPATQLQYLNARYYDPELALFIQPDWLDPMLPGVGTHRYAYAGQDPVNARDPGGNIKKPPVTDGGPKPGVVGPTHCTRCGSPFGPKDDTGGEMGGLNGEWRNDGTATCLHCYNDASMFLAPATVVTSAGRVLIEIYARTAQTRHLMLAALMGEGGFLRSPIGLETLRRIASGTRIARVYEMMDFDDRSDSNFRWGMSQAGSYQMFINPDLVTDTYKGFDGVRHNYVLAQGIGHEFGHGVGGWGKGDENELEVISRYDNVYLQSDGWTRGELRDGY